jgi:hypothetical protein
MDENAAASGISFSDLIKTEQDGIFASLAMTTASAAPSRYRETVAT